MKSSKNKIKHLLPVKKRPSNKTDIQGEIQSALATIRTLALQAKYADAKLRIEKLRRTHKANFEIEYFYAKLLGDYADELSFSKKQKLKQIAVEILRDLIRKLNGKPVDVRFGVRINYYYQSEKFSLLEQIGKDLLQTQKINGLYAAGAGASLEAERISRGNRKNVRTAKKCATRAVAYWHSYFLIKKNEKYYFPFTLLATSRAILGDKRGMEKALQTASQLSGRIKNYWEFEDVRNLFMEVNGKPYAS